MARVPIPSPDVPFLEPGPGGLVSRPWLDFLTSLDLLRVMDIADVPHTTPSNGDTIRYSTATKKWSYGA